MCLRNHARWYACAYAQAQQHALRFGANLIQSRVFVMNSIHYLHVTNSYLHVMNSQTHVHIVLVHGRACAREVFMHDDLLAYTRMFAFSWVCESILWERLHAHITHISTYTCWYVHIHTHIYTQTYA